MLLVLITPFTGLIKLGTSGYKNNYKQEMKYNEAIKRGAKSNVVMSVVTCERADCGVSYHHPLLGEGWCRTHPYMFNTVQRGSVRTGQCAGGFGREGQFM